MYNFKNLYYKYFQHSVSYPKTVTRVEIINENGRAFVDTNSTYTLSFQDNNQTLKLFKQETKCH